MSQYIKTYGRIRPSAKGKDASALVATDKSVSIETDNGPKNFELHRIFDSEATQEEIFACVAKKVVEDSAEGFNGTIFAYGQTGSGKTHTMLGPCNSWSDPLRKGLIPRSVEQLFQLLDAKIQECQKFSFEVTAEFVELYNEEIFDLLNSKNKVQLRDSGKEIQLVGAKSETVDNSLDLMHVVERGWQSRSTGSTAMNNESSRSHAMLIIKIKTYEMTGGLIKERYSTLNLVDLAGSERQSHTKSGGDQLKEAANINASLTVLGRCIRILSKPSGGNTYVPYRDSHLTHILKNSLGGNSKTAVIVNMHPDREFLPESSSTLMFAQSCTMIKNAVTRNEVMTGDQENSYKKAIQELRKEVDETRAKAREEFSKKLDEAEVVRCRLELENDVLKSDNSELRAKYNYALVKYITEAGSENTISEFERILSENINSVLDADLRDLVSKNQTLKLECDANEKRVQDLQQELNELRSRYQDNLNATLQMQTPAKERRSSTRPKRRETQYKPSPARLAELIEDDDSDQKLMEAAVRVEQSECEVKALQCELAEARAKETKMQLEFDKTRNDLLKKINGYSSELDGVCAENQDLRGKVEKSSKNLDDLLVSNATLREEKDKLEKQKDEVIEKIENEMEELRKHYVSQDSTRTNALQQKDLAIDEFKIELNSKMDLIAQHQQEIEKLQKCYASQLDTLEQNAMTINDLQKELSSKTDLVALLQQEIHEKSQSTAKVDEDLSKKAGLIAKLEETVTKLQTEKNENASELSTLKRRLEASIRDEAHEKKRCEDLQKKIQTDFEGYQRDIKTLREKKDREIKSIQQSLDLAQEALKNHDKSLQKQKTEAQKKFDDDVAALEKRFKETHIKELKQQEESVRRESLSLMEMSIRAKDDKISELEHMNEYYKRIHEEDTETIAKGFGKQDRHKYWEKLRNGKADQEGTIAQLLSDNNRLSKGNRDSNRPVLRSRNTQH